MPALSSPVMQWELDSARDCLEGIFLNDTCDVKRPVRVSDGQGGSTVTYTTPLTNIKCRIIASLGNLNSKEIPRLDTVETVSNWTLLVEWDVDIKPQDIIVVNSASLTPPHNTFEVVDAFRERTQSFLGAINIQKITKSGNEFP